MSAQPLLSVERVTVEYDGYKALDDLTLRVEAGAIVVLIGPNGAGKSTLLDAIIGRVRPTAGRIVFKGEDLAKVAEHRIVRRGICRKFQTPGVLESLTIEDNLAIAARRKVDNRVSEVVTMIGLEPKRRFLAGQLSHGEKQWLEIGMVVAAEPDLLLLDEPAAGMTHSEAELTARLIRSLAGKHACVVIDHDMDFVAQLAAPVSVLHMGRLIAQGSIDEVRRDPNVVAVYLGRQAAA